MKDFLLSPFKAIYNLDTYIKATKQSFGKILLFLIYLIALSSILFFVGIIVRTPPLDPVLRDITVKIAEITPNIEITNGIIKAEDGQYIEIQPDASFPKVVFETNRTEPVYPTQMEQDGIAAFITAENIYIASGNGQIKAVQLDKKLNTTINKEFILTNQDNIILSVKQFLFYLLLLIMPIVITFFTLILFVLAIVAAAISQMFAKADVSFWDVVRICCYLLAPALIFLFIVIIIPLNIPLIWLICFIIFIVYSQLIFTKIKMLGAKEEDVKKEDNKENED